MCLPVDETNQVDPLSPHAVGKLAAEMYLRAYAEICCLAPICLALAYVYGPRQSPHGAAGVVAVLCSAMITERPSAVYRDGAEVYVYVDDGLMSAVLDGASLSSHNEDPCDELNAIALDATKAANELGWTPKVDIAEGIRRTIRWLCATLEPEAPALVSRRLETRISSTRQRTGRFGRWHRIEGAVMGYSTVTDLPRLRGVSMS